MKKLFLYFSLLFVILLFSPPSKATDIYFAQTAAGAGNGTSCANAYAWTDGTHGINVATQQATGGVGNKLHLCGTITATVGTNGIVAATSGSSASPVIVQFETGAILQSPAWPGASDGQGSCGAASQGGAIVIHGFSNWIIDGGLSGLSPQGIIQNTANGTGLANTANSVGIWVDGGGDNFIIRNLNIQNIYLRQASAGTNSNGGCTSAIRVIGATSTKICNSLFASSFMDAEFNSNDASPIVLTTLPNCQSNTFSTHSSSFFNNTLKDMNRGAFFSGTGAPLLANNDIQLNSDNWTGNVTYFHSSGFFIVGSSSATFHPYVVANYCHGTQASASPTGCFYSTDGNPNDGSGNSITYVRNIVYGIGPAITCCFAFSWTLDTGDPKGTVQMYNNTIINTGRGNELYRAVANPTSYDHQNNLYIIQPGGSDGYFFVDEGNGRWAFSIANFQGNDYFMGRNACGTGCAFGMFQGVSVFSTWKTNCVSGSGTGCDSNSIITDPVLAGESTFASGTDSFDGSAFYLTSGSNAIAHGTNLTPSCSSMYGLCIGPPQFFGAGGSCGSGCVSQNNSTFDIGAFPFSGVTSYWTPDLTAVSSGPTFRDFSWTGFPEGKGTTLDSSAVGQYVTFTVNVATAGTYDVKYSTKEYSTRGIAQLSINGTNVGAAQDQYAPCCGTYVTYDLGNYNFATAGNYSFKFTVTGKNASSTGYTMAWDDITLK